MLSHCYHTPQSVLSISYNKRPSYLITDIACLICNRIKVHNSQTKPPAPCAPSWQCADSLLCARIPAPCNNAPESRLLVTLSGTMRLLLVTLSITRSRRIVNLGVHNAGVFFRLIVINTISIVIV